jgi:hypothetical protein
MINIFIGILLSIIILGIVIMIYIKQKIYKKTSDNLINALSKNLFFFTELNKKQEIVNLKNSIDLYSKFQVILKISKCDYISFFKYDYSNRYIVLHFILSIDNNGTIIQTNILDKLPITANLSILNILKSDDEDLYLLPLSDIESKNDNFFRHLSNNGINTIYYQNVFKYKETPLGFISLAYKNKNYIILQEDKVEILRIIEEMKSLI